MKIAIVGAESTGKTSLAHDLTQAMQADGKSACWVPELLREWCNAHGRTPLPHEQNAIALEQAKRVNLAGPSDFLISDTSPLVTAVYSELLFNDRSLYPFALEHQKIYDLTLLTGLDLPWVADGIQRDGPRAREQFDAQLRHVLGHNRLNYTVVYGSGSQRTKNALQAIERASRSGAQPATRRTSAWKWSCEKCSDAECEHRMFTDRLQIGLLN